MQQLSTLISALEQHIPQHECLNEKISAASVGWHIEHTLLVLNGVIKSVAQSDPNAYKWSFNFPRMVVLFSNKIPRGRGKAPKKTQPNKEFNAETLDNRVAAVRETLKMVEGLHPKSNFEHPYFKQLNLKQTLQFLGIHTQHHLDIIEDIIKSK
jgi:hypothetical protein